MGERSRLGKHKEPLSIAPSLSVFTSSEANRVLTRARFGLKGNTRRRKNRTYKSSRFTLKLSYTTLSVCRRKSKLTRSICPVSQRPFASMQSNKLIYKSPPTKEIRKLQNERKPGPDFDLDLKAYNENNQQETKERPLMDFGIMNASSFPSSFFSLPPFSV
jgi:hypothetical protein